MPHLSKITVRFAGTDRCLDFVDRVLRLINRRPPSIGEAIHLVANNRFMPELPLKHIQHVGGEQSDARSCAVDGVGIVLDLIQYRLLLPDSKVVDLGCGCGRVALYAAPYLIDVGTYDGFDTWGDGIRWARENITPIYPQMRFHHLTPDPETGAGGYESDAAFRLDLEDCSCNLVIAASLVTHLTRNAAREYMREIYRILDASGTAYLTFFLYDEESKQVLKDIPMEHVDGGRRFDHSDFSDFYFYESTVDDMLSRARLQKLLQVRGPWRGERYKDERRPTAYQDLYIVRRAPH